LQRNVLKLFREDGGFPHYDVPYGGLPPPPVAGAVPPAAWMSGSSDVGNKAYVSRFFFKFT